jgi:hypothetical protein
VSLPSTGSPAPPAPAPPAVPQLFDADDRGVVLCLAPGPSLTNDDLVWVFTHFPYLAVVTVNDAWTRWKPSYRYSSDVTWWRSHPEARRDRSSGCYTLGHDDLPPDVTGLNYYVDESRVLSDDPGFLVTGGHSGYAAINFAYLLGAATIVLLGYDMQPDPATGAHHAGGDQPGQKHPRYFRWLPRYRSLRVALNARGVALVNCTRATAIPDAYVPRRPLTSLVL